MFPNQLYSHSQNQNRKKKNSIEVKIIDNQIFILVTSDGIPFIIDEIIARKKFTTRWTFM